MIVIQPQTVYAEPEREAWKHLTKAVYVQEGGPATAKRVEQLYVPKWVKSEPGTLIMIIIKGGVEKRLEYRWDW